MITSGGNKKVKWVAQLNKKAGLRHKEDVFTAEGIKMFQEAPETAIKEIYLSESLRDMVYKTSSMDKEKRKLESCRYEVVSDAVFEKMSDTRSPQGILCVLRQFHYSFADMLQNKARHNTALRSDTLRMETLRTEKAPLFLVLENLQDPGNLGTILRAGEGAGVTGVIMSRDTADIYNPKTIRSTMGSIYRVPFCYSEDLLQTVKEMKKGGITVYAAHLKGEKNYEEGCYRTAAAFLIGNEGNGLTEELAQTADTYIRIPMQGQVESLNAAVASALLVFEAARQRRQCEK